jgi:hypothetical protein
VAPAWQDELIGTSECATATTIPLAHQISVPQQGHYGATIFARPRGTQESVWLGALRADDARFTISHDDVEITQERERMLNEMREIALSMLTLSVQYPHTLPEQIQTIRSYAPHLGLGALMKEAVDSLGEEVCLERLHDTLTADPASAEVISLLSIYGVGETVFTTPEGPHAAAGGLAQVISGLPRELQKAGIPVTVITPLYAYENGNKHASAQHILSQGIQLGAEKVIPTYLGSVTVNLGPTYHTGTTFHRRALSACVRR